MPHASSFKELTIINILSRVSALFLLINAVMMAFRLLVSVFFLITAIAFAQDGVESRVLISGVIKDSTDNPVSYAHIFSKSRNEGWVSDYYGTFRASVIQGDTLVISAVSYHPSHLIVPFETQGKEFLAEVIMLKQTFELDEVVIRPWPATFEQLEKEFMQIEIEDPVAINIQPYLPTPEELRNLAYPQGGIVIKGPISSIYDQFSKEAKSKRIYADLMQKEKAGKKYNKAVVSKITGLKNDDEIIKFMEFCALQIKFILESTEYELFAAVLGCYNEYCERGYGPEPAAE
jgi:hypothetical protein